MEKALVAIVDFGKFSSERIANVMYNLKIEYIIIHPEEDYIDFIPTHIILSGSEKHVYNHDRYIMPRWVLKLNVPVLGICYGMQLIAYTFGGIVIRMNNLQKGPIDVIEKINKNKIKTKRWMNRYDRILLAPSFFKITGITKDKHIAAFTDNKKWWGVQYHPESDYYVDYNVFIRFLEK
jgi:GMP synthase (glutamine-hydrolysing)